ncbi:hypothetical protein TNCV_4562921 [Trichonephila clavipes]|uniref:Uncharacterized protein n=1 Tax=Trichonephila clavipes TaxID=2585209 RepID=A0A8X6W448_TRICX|nr:hypothetical protein TNCV_4562921 [Trichonephila clavipes]
MAVQVVQSLKGLCNSRFAEWVSGAIDLREYHCSMLTIGLHVLSGQESTETGVKRTGNESVKGHRPAPTNHTELRTALANIWQVMPVERFQKLVESMCRRMEAIIKARGGSQLVTR